MIVTVHICLQNLGCFVTLGVSMPSSVHNYAFASQTQSQSQFEMSSNFTEDTHDTGLKLG